MVCYLLRNGGEPFVLPQAWECLLPSERVAKAKAFKLEKDREACILSYLLLRYAVFCETKISEILHLQPDANGKPQDPLGRFHFNISHCDTAIACACDSAPVGVDVQHFTAVRENVVKKVCTPFEQARLVQCGYDEKLFAAFWSAKEAYGKYTGEGIGYALQAYDFCPDSLFPQETCLDGVRICTSLHDSFALSVCSSQKQDFLPVSYEQLRTFCTVLTNAL